MDFIISYWYVLAAIAVLVVCGGVVIYRFIALPSEAQLGKVREWLLWAVTQAETELGSGTGQLKLRKVYDMFVQRFSWIAKLISFERFSDMVDDALVEMRNMLEQNAAVAALVSGAAAEEAEQT